MKIEPKIIFEDPDFLAVNKPAGMEVHLSPNTKDETLTEWLEKNRPEIAGVGEKIKIGQKEEVLRCGLAHRIDKETSGVILIAKNDQAFLHLKNLFQKRKVKKIYHAFVYGVPKNETGKIDLPIGRDARDPRKKSVAKNARGEIKESVTWYRMIKKGITKISDSESEKEYSFLEVVPKTGRTHQIRVHLRAIKNPIICDPLYSDGKPPMLGFKRLALHALSLEFKDQKGELIKIKAEYPEDFQKALKDLI